MTDITILIPVKRSIFKFFAVFGIITQVMMSCSKDSTSEIKTEEPANIPANYIALAINPIDQDTEVEIAPISSNSRIASKGKVNPEYSLISTDVGLDARVSISQESLSSSPKLMATDLNVSINSKTLKAAIPVGYSLLGTGVRYRLFIYKADGSLFRTKIMTSGTTLDTIHVMRNTNYTYKTYSFNKTSAQESAGGPNLNSTSQVVTTGNYDFLFASGTIPPYSISTGTSASSPLNIQFKHRVSKIRVSYDIRGLFTYAAGGSPIPHVIDFEIVSNTNSTLVPAFKKGQFSLATGDFIQGSFVGYTPTELKPVWTNYIGSTFNDYSWMDVYTAEAGTFSGLSLKINKLQYYRDESSLTTVNATASSPLILTVNKTFNVVEGVGNHVRFEFIEPYVTLPSSSGSTIKWGRGNLAFRGWGTHNPYVFRKVSTTTTVATNFDGSSDRFRFNDLYPELYAIYWFAASSITESNGFKHPPMRTQVRGLTDSIGDPCGLVRPAGTWRSPTATELLALVNYFNTNKANSWFPAGQGHIAFPSSGPVTSKLPFIQHNNLLLEKNGLANYSTPFGANSFSATGDDVSANYWSSSQHQFLSITGTSATAAANVASMQTSAVSDVNKTMYIRCVRAQ